MKLILVRTRTLLYTSLLLLISGCGQLLGGACIEGEDADNDGITDCDEEVTGTDPLLEDSDGDGYTDAEEVDCISDPLDSSEKCYACGWPHNNPGDLSSTGNSIGDVIKNIKMNDQCGERVQIWDFFGEYHILYMTAAW